MHPHLLSETKNKGESHSTIHISRRRYTVSIALDLHALPVFVTPFPAASFPTRSPTSGIASRSVARRGLSEGVSTDIDLGRDKKNLPPGRYRGSKRSGITQLRAARTTIDESAASLRRAAVSFLSYRTSSACTGRRVVCEARSKALLRRRNLFD